MTEHRTALTASPAPLSEVFDGGAPARMLLEALPMVALVVDGAQRIRALNGAAAAHLARTEEEAVGLRLGDVLDCEELAPGPRGCGTSPTCGACGLRRVTLSALRGLAVDQEEVPVLVRGPVPRRRHLLVSASPLDVGEAPHALVLLQDVTPLHRLRGLIPMCAGCKRIRDDEEAWQAVDGWISDHSHAEFTHSLCPECLEAWYPEAG